MSFHFQVFLVVFRELLADNLCIEIASCIHYKYSSLFATLDMLSETFKKGVTIQLCPLQISCVVSPSPQ